MVYISIMNKIIMILLTLPLLIFLYSASVSAECIEGDCNNGKGTLEWTNNSSYTGEFRNGKANGLGEATWSIGKKTNRYVGEWKDDMPHGQGIYIGFDGSRYEGEWKEGQWHGQGTYTWPDGRQYKGEFRNGEMVDSND
jgi:hypothetical protein